MDQKKITIVTVDNHELTRIGIRKTIEGVSNMEVVGEAANGDDGIEVVEKQRPKVMLLETQIPGMPAREVGRRVREKLPEVVTLVLTDQDRDATLSEFIKLGVSGFLCKKRTGENLISDIRRAVKGELLFTSEQWERAHAWDKQVREKWEELTNREKQILCLMGKGETDQEIAKKLCISRRTVSFHIERMLQKLPVSKRVQAVVWLNRSGLLDL